MGLFKCLNFQSFPLYLSKRKASVHFHEQMPCLKAVFLQPLPEIWKSDDREVEIILCEFTRVMSCLIHRPHALKCHARHLCL